MLGSVHDAEGLVQETYLRAWRARDAYAPSRAALGTWLDRIASHACLTRREWERVRQRALRYAISQLDALTHQQFAYAVRDLMRRDGCSDALRVGGRGDLGADVKATDPHGRRWVIQCKHRRSGTKGSASPCTASASSGAPTGSVPPWPGKTGPLPPRTSGASRKKMLPTTARPPRARSWTRKTPRTRTPPPPQNPATRTAPRRT
ncbi:hypothetical protein G3I62_12080 [Streptomyces sp. SID14446]|nr:hypothetical protein [Streptomyces sp. SID14446]